MKIVLASSNEHKVKEINEISLGEGIEFVLPHSGFAPVEDGKTFEENSLIKALEAWKLSKTFPPPENNFILNPILANLYCKLTSNTSSPYLQERIKFIEEASAKYLVGQEISPIL